MVDMKALQKNISDSGTTIVALAKNAGIERTTLYNRLKGIGEFTASEIVGLAGALRMTNAERDAIFFAHEVE